MASIERARLTPCSFSAAAAPLREKVQVGRGACQQTKRRASSPKIGARGTRLCAQGGRYGESVGALTGEHAGPPPDGKGPRPPSSPELWSRSDRRWDRIRWTLLACWLVVVVATVFTGERASSWTEVRRLVATGDVDTVHVVGELPAGGSGYSIVEVHWRHGMMRYATEVAQVRGRSDSPRAATDGAVPVLHAAPSSQLSALRPGLRVIRDQQRASGGRLFGWQVTGSLALLAFLLVFACLGVLVAGPEPWRANRWAWFWLLLPPVGAIAFLLASGPTPGLRAPRDAHRRLSGGWAFLLSLLLTSVLAPHQW